MTDRQGPHQMNLAAVRRHDPYVTQIVDSATQVAVYDYCSDTTEWKKTDMQGALFVYDRSGPPLHSFMVLNRLSTNNLIQPLTSELDWQLQAPFLLYRTAQGSIYGVWFFYEEECSRIAALLESLCQSTGSDPSASGGGGAKQSAGGIDLMSLFKKASEQPGVPVAPPLMPMPPPPVTGPPPGPGSRPTTPREEAHRSPAGITVADLFAKASKTGQVSIGKQTVRSISVSEVEHAMPDLGGRPRAATETHTPARHLLTGQLSQPVTGQPAASAEPAAPAPPPLTPAKDGTAAEARQAGDVDRIQQLFSSDLRRVGSRPISVPRPQTPVGAALDARDASPAVLMSPMMFSATPTVAPPAAELGSSVASGDHAMALMAAGGATVVREELEREATADADGDLDEVTPLTRRQLLQALNYLLKNDESFVEKLHEAYVRSLQESFKRS